MKLTNDPQFLKVAAGLVLAGLLLFGASFNDPFHFDDILIVADSNVADAGRWHHFLNPLHLRQLTFFSFYLNHLIHGMTPSGFHVVNVVLHTANALLLFCLLSRFLERWTAVTAAAIFLAHPIQTESVLYIYQRSILLACFFSLLGLIAAAERRPWIAALFFLFAFESKESAIAVPLALGVLYGRRFSGSAALQRLAYLVGAAALGVVALAVLFYQDEETVGIGAVDQVSPFTYAAAQTRVMYTYMRLLVFPYPQSLEYEFPRVASILPLLGLLIVGAASLWFSRDEKWRIPAVCVLAFFLLLAPTSSIVPSADAAFEHRLYLPMLAFSVFAAFFLAKLRARTVAGSAVLIVLSVLTVVRGQAWATDIALWEDAVKKAPNKARPWFNLGGAYLTVDPERARSALLHGLELSPESAEALYNLGVIEQKAGNFREAVNYYERTITADAQHWRAWNNLGNSLFAVGQRSRALDCFESTLRLNPDYWPAQYNIAIVQFTNGQFDKALPRLRTVLDWRPDYSEARRLLALSLTQAGRRSEAEAEWRKMGEIAAAAESRHTPTMILAPARP